MRQKRSFLSTTDEKSLKKIIFVPRTVNDFGFSVRKRKGAGVVELARLESE